MVDRLPSGIVRDLSFQTVGGYVNTAAQVVRGLVLAGLLGPAGLGVLALVAMVVSYAQYSDLGMGQAVGREIPLARGQRDACAADAWAWHGYAGKLSTALLAGLGVLAWTLLVGPPRDATVRFGLILAFPIIVLQAVVMVQQSVMMANRLFVAASVSSVVAAGLSLVFGIVGAVLAGVQGVFVSQVVALALAVCAGAILGGLPRASRIERHRLAVLVKVGLPLALLTLLGSNLVWVDQLVVASLFDRSALGLYTLVLYAGSAMYLLPTALAAVVSPRLIARFGERGEAGAIAGHTWKPVDILSVLLPWEVAAVWVLGPVVIDVFLPEYSSIIAPLRLYAVGMFFLSLTLGVSSVLVALNKHRYNLPIVGLALTLNVALDLVFVSAWGWGLWAVALGSMTTYAAYWMGHMTLVRHYFGTSVPSALWRNLLVGWPGLALVVFAGVAAATGTLASSSFVSEAALLAVVAAVSLLRYGQAAGFRHWGVA